MSNNIIDEMMGNIVMSDELKNKIQERMMGKVVKFRRPSMKRIVLVASLCVTILGATTIAIASNIEKIEKYFMNILGYDMDTQNELDEEGFYQNMELAFNEGDIVSVTNDGITVAVKETIVDKSAIKALIQIRSEDGTELDDSSYFKDWTIKGFVDEVPNVGASPYVYTSTMEYALQGAENLEGQWCIVNIVNHNEAPLKSGDIVEITFDKIIKHSWITERICEVKDGATFMYDGQEYVLKKVGHADEVTEDTIYDLDHWSNMYCIDIDSEGNAYALVDVYGNPIESPCRMIAIDSCEDGEYLVEVMDFENTDTVSDGEWTLKWELNVNEKCVQIPVNETIEANDLKYPIDNVQITPCSLKICFSEVIENLYEYKPLEINIYMKDGSVCELNETGELASRFGVDWYGFRSALSLNNIEKISIEGKEYTVSE